MDHAMIRGHAGPGLAEFEYRLAPDDLDLFDGRQAARLLIADAYLLLAVYADTQDQAKWFFRATADQVFGEVRLEFRECAGLPWVRLRADLTQMKEFRGHSYRSHHAVMTMHYPMEVDENEITDNFTLARPMIRDAILALGPYAGGTFSKTEALFHHVAKAAMRKAIRERESQGRPAMAAFGNHATREEGLKALQRHRAAKEARTAAVMRRAGLISYRH